MRLSETPWCSLAQIEARVCDLAAEQVGMRRDNVFPESRLIQDLHCDSLDFVELLMAIEDAFDVSLPDEPPNLAYKQVFTRTPFRLRDLAEMVYMQQGSGRVPRSGLFARKLAPVPARTARPFLQLGGHAATQRAAAAAAAAAYTPLGKNDHGLQTFRRSTDGMPCLLIPACANVIIGDDHGNPDERPAHQEQIDAFFIDQEPVSTTAYCRFLNSIHDTDDVVDRDTLQRWFLLPPNDHRRPYELLAFDKSGWSPRPGVERFPMVLVSWYGAAAYARWANGRDWRAASDVRDIPAAANDEDGDYLPTEAQWEYAARGAEPRRFPWGDDQPTASHMRFASHRRGARYQPDALPMADVNEPLGVSPFGLLHMAGNVWQWCRDWYAPDAYSTLPNPDSRRPPTGIRSERGGSWIGSASLCRSAYRRGRAPAAKGRCLGFRCIGHP